MNLREQQSQLKQQVIFEAACHCFAEKGYNGTSVQSIAERAGVSKGLIFNYFRSKQKLFEQVLKHTMEQWYDMSMAYSVAEKSNDPIATLTRTLRAPFDAMNKMPLLMAIISWDEPMLHERWPMISQANRRWRLQIEKQLKGGIDSGHFRKNLDTAITADVLHTLMKAHYSRMFMDGKAHRLNQKTVDTVVDLAVHSVKA
ncbi:hypothetical protein EOPP23_07005 [Endozoicomonas sp. OPT23]|uniref:TetR/AcrR family transcriptional regulator n=1 Tax=Endozoicomonas sp. OPT23 TaxID=2072845 RepID=UPI00129A877A|nr:TetR/AcrR family transcriptional regulator [Endozoicomonas sp. OPT23]MRI32734.1 hypothetical protein [Endozoicomonas sp. OPT23]